MRASSSTSPLTPDGPVTVHAGEYSTDLVRDKALAYLDDGIGGDKPFFLGIAPIAPHSCKLALPCLPPSFAFLHLLTLPPVPQDIPLTTGIPHNRLEEGPVTMHIPSPHPRHANLFASEQVPRSASFNPDEPHGVSWVRTLPKLVSRGKGS